MTIKRRILNILIAIDQFLFVILTLGWAYPDETISAAAYRLSLKGKWYGKASVKIIDFLFILMEKDHCRISYYSELNKAHLPEIYRR